MGDGIQLHFLTEALKTGSAVIQQLSRSQLGPYVVAVSAAYPIVCSLLRFRRKRWLHQEYHFPTRESLACMTDDEAWEIQKVLLQLEFPFFYIKALQFALFRTYGIPSISDVLVRTGQFSMPETSLKRYTDTTALVQEFMGHKPSSERACSAIARIHFLHKDYREKQRIKEDDMLYTLGLFAIQPVRFIDMYEWRTLTDTEKCAIGTFWKSVGDGLEISYEKLPSGPNGFRDGLHWLEEIITWSDDYELEFMRPDDRNRKVANQTTQMLLYMVPRPLQHIGLKFVSFMMDDLLREAMLYDPPPSSYATVFSSLLSIRRFVMRYLTLPRPYALRYTAFTEQMDKDKRVFITQWDAAPYYVKPTFWNRWGPTAWLTWALGKPLPGDMGDKFYPQGYRIDDVGPSRFQGKGQKEMDERKVYLNANRTGQCPFIGA